MSTRFVQQDAVVNFSFSKSAQTPQHGQKSDPKIVRLKEKRSFEPRPGH